METIKCDNCSKEVLAEDVVVLQIDENEEEVWCQHCVDNEPASWTDSMIERNKQLWRY